MSVRLSSMFSETTGPFGFKFSGVTSGTKTAVSGDFGFKILDFNVRFWTFLVFGRSPILEWPFRVEGGTLEKNVQYEK